MISAIQLILSFLWFLPEMSPISHASLLSYNRKESRIFMSSKSSFESGSKNTAELGSYHLIMFFIIPYRVFTIADPFPSTETALTFLCIHRGKTETLGQLTMPQKQMPQKLQGPLPKVHFSPLHLQIMVLTIQVHVWANILLLALKFLWM